MKFSKKSRYGLTALIDLAVHSKEGHVSLSSIAERNHISLQYLEQIFASLKRARIVKSIKGSQGGYLLNLAPENISTAAVIEALEGNYLLEEEEAIGDSEHRIIASTIQKKVIDEVNRKLDETLQNLTLAELEKECLLYNEYNQNMYYI